MVFKGEKPALRGPQGRIFLRETVLDDLDFGVRLEIVDDGFGALERIDVVFLAGRMDIDGFWRMDVAVEGFGFSQGELLLARQERDLDAFADPGRSEIRMDHRRMGSFLRHGQ